MNLPLRDLIGPLPDENLKKSRMRFHQGWWRAFVLGVAAGPHPTQAGKLVCNVKQDGHAPDGNFVGTNTFDVVRRTLAERGSECNRAGIIEEQRLYNNLLSSQPLAFNFFAQLQHDPQLATQLVKRMVPDIDEVLAVRFEFAPADWIDNSAFDVALEVRRGSQRGLFGIECKYTDSFSSTCYDRAEYPGHYDISQAFTAPYKTCISGRFNQLFRNQLIAEALVRSDQYQFRLTGLLCHEDDDAAIATARDFQAILRDGETSFHILTYKRFIEELQQLPLTWEQRCWSMMLWARYCAMELSKAAYETSKHKD